MTARRTGVVWPVVVAAVLLFTAMISTEASAAAEARLQHTAHTAQAAEPVQPTRIAPHGRGASPGHAHGQGERDGQAGTGDHEATRSRTAVRRYSCSRDLGPVPVHQPPSAYRAPRPWDTACGTDVVRGPHARHSGRSPGARLLIALNISRT